MISTLLNLYLQINLLLAVSYAVFKLSQTITVKLKTQPSFQATTRIAQILILASIAVPLIFALMPTQNLPRLQFTPVQPLSDGVGIVLRTKAAPRIQAALPDFVKTNEHQSLFSIFEKSKPAILKLLLLLLTLGFGLMSLRLLKNLRHLKNIITDSSMIRKIGKVVIFVSDSVTIPLSTLIGRHAVILVPPNIVSNSKDLRIAIRHELQHHRQWDTAWAIHIEFLICAFYANPAIYFWKRQIIELQEFSCDEALIGRRGVLSQDYGGCLIRVAEAALGNREMPVGTAGMAAGSKNSRYFKSFLRRRIEMFTERSSRRRTLSVAMAFGTLSLLTTVAVAYGAQQVLRPRLPAIPNPGHAVFDPNVQSIAQNALESAIKSYGAKAGFVLVSDPVTGRLLAVANVAKDPQKQGKPWSLSYLLEPASAMKGITVAAAADRHVISMDEQFNCENGTYVYGHNRINDWTPFQSLSATDTLAQSSNICGIKIGAKFGVNGLVKMLSDFGFGVGGTTDGFPEAAAGVIPRPTQLTEEEYVALISTGYTMQAQFTVTPLEMVQAYGAIANDGKLMKAIQANAPDSSVSVVRQVIEPSTAESIKVALRKVVTDGTGKPARSKLYTTAGKTSTAFTPGTIQHESLGGERSMGGFIGFAPVDKPRVVIYVGVIGPMSLKDHQPRGSSSAAPIFKQVAEEVLQYMKVAPDKN